ncbi:MAG: N-acetylmuramoyl-L-alanine amidase [Dehalococcoidia bacterium]|nr:N-acetylmuramoyl-L-alanine amidase [Dehalococcoidia bacterium]
MSRTRMIGILMFVAMMWVGCSASGQPGVGKVGRELDSIQPASTLPSLFEDKVAVGTLPSAPDILPAAEARSSQMTSAIPEKPGPAPTMPPVAMLSTAAERPNQESPGQSGSAPQGGSPPLRSATLDSDPQALLLHPFMPAGGRARIIVLDPGHGGAEVGAAGAGLAEKNVNLSIAKELRSLLEQDGMKVVLAREDDSRANALLADGSLQATSATRQDLQARLDLANREQADVYISIHNNGSGNPDMSGTEVWYDGKRPFGAFNAALADETLAAILDNIHGLGYPTKNRGLKEDSNYRVFNGRAYPLFVLGPPRSGSGASRAAQMPAILGETLFLSNPAEAWQLTRVEMISAIAEGYRQGLTIFSTRR